ncbi:hypothetical protein [Paenibacillus gansuensis]|uniref:Uncharacterized protein n=1 Tax=Paenibacillus gansuensis TaxID=306542 RepID=A0ABW5PFV6_9BACL
MAYYISYKNQILGTGMTKQRAEEKLRDLKLSFAGLELVEVKEEDAAKPVTKKPRKPRKSVQA